MLLKLFKKILKSRIAMKILAFLIYVYTGFAARTIRWNFKNSKNIDFLINNQVILVGWHARAVMLPYFWRRFTDKGLYALASPHQDGQIIANFLKLFKISVISGSTNEKASQSALGIMRLLNDGQTITITPDGPRGPRMRMKKSPVYFASHTGLPIVFVSFSTSHALIIKKAWDKTLVALPFGKGVFVASDPLYVPKDLNDEELEQYRIKLENIANDLNINCDKEAGIEPILPADQQEIRIKKYPKGA